MGSSERLFRNLGTYSIDGELKLGYEVSEKGTCPVVRKFPMEADCGFEFDDALSRRWYIFCTTSH